MILDRLGRLDTPAVSDALDRLGLPGLALAHLRPLSVPRRIAGRVQTVRLVAADGRPPGKHLGVSAIEAAGPQDVIVVAHPGPSDVSGWGGLLALGAVRRGVRGIVVDGACRDLDEMVELDLPVYAAAATPRTARGRLVEADWNRPIVVGGATVHPGDLVIADRSGVVFVPAARADEIVAVAEGLFARETAMADALRDGKTMTEALGAYETLLERAT